MLISTKILEDFYEIKNIHISCENEKKFEAIEIETND